MALLRYGEPDWDAPPVQPNSFGDILQRPKSNKSYEELRLEAQENELFKIFNTSSARAALNNSSKFVGLRDLTETVTIIVGQNFDSAQWVVHKKLLTESSPFAAAMMKYSCREKNENIIRYPEEKPAIFDHYVKFLYTNCIITFSLQTLVEMYTLGDRINAVNFTAACYEAMQQNQGTYTADQLKYVFDNTTENDKLRRLCITQVGQGILSGKYTFSLNHEREALAEYMVEIMQGVTAAVAGKPLGTNPPALTSHEAPRPLQFLKTTTSAPTAGFGIQSASSAIPSLFGNVPRDRLLSQFDGAGPSSSQSGTGSAPAISPAPSGVNTVVPTSTAFTLGQTSQNLRPFGPRSANAAMPSPSNFTASSSTQHHDSIAANPQAPPASGFSFGQVSTTQGRPAGSPNIHIQAAIPFGTPRPKTNAGMSSQTGPSDSSATVVASAGFSYGPNPSAQSAIITQSVPSEASSGLLSTSTADPGLFPSNKSPIASTSGIFSEKEIEAARSSFAATPPQSTLLQRPLPIWDSLIGRSTAIQQTFNENGIDTAGNSVIGTPTRIIPHVGSHGKPFNAHFPSDNLEQVQYTGKGKEKEVENSLTDSDTTAGAPTPGSSSSNSSETPTVVVDTTSLKPSTDPVRPSGFSAYAPNAQATGSAQASPQTTSSSNSSPSPFAMSSSKPLFGTTRDPNVASSTWQSTLIGRGELKDKAAEASGSTGDMTSISTNTKTKIEGEISHYLAGRTTPRLGANTSTSTSAQTPTTPAFGKPTPISPPFQYGTPSLKMGSAGT